MKKTVLLAFVSALLLLICLTVGSAHEVMDPGHIIVNTIGMEPETVDPAWAYDTASGELVSNVYDTLISFAVNRSAPHAKAGKVDQFVPCLATTWTVSSDGKTYTFRIREGVKFHNNAILTTEDVEYSFERAMVQDRNGGPIWMFYEHLLGTFGSRPFTQYPGDETGLATLIDNAILSNATHVWFNLIKPYSPFLSILAQSYGAIVNKAFCIEYGGWNGTWFWSGGNWTEYNNPERSPLDTGGDWVCGTGPYKLDYWNRGDGTWALVKFDDYWGGWPAPDCYGYVDRVTVTDVTNLLYTKSWWPFVVQPFLDGETDILRVSAEYIGDLEVYSGVRCIENLPSLSVWAMLFNFNVTGWIPYVLPPSTFDESGFPSDLFSDVDARKGFAYSFNYTGYIEEVYYAGEAVRLTCPSPVQLYYNPAQLGYTFNSSKAEEHFRTAWGGELWLEGFNMTIIYIRGNELRRIACEMLKANVENLNPKFHINVVEVDFHYYFIQIVDGKAPLLFMGWWADIPDPYDFFSCFMYSLGSWAQYQSYNSTIVDELIDEGRHTVNETRRREILDELQAIYFDECPSVPLSQPCKRHHERDWVQGWYYNPIYHGFYFYHLWKAHIGDINGDGTVNMLDLGTISAHWYPGPPIGPSGYLFTADLNADGNVNIIDVAILSANWGHTP